MATYRLYPVSIAAASDLVAVTGAQLARAWWLAVMAVIGACGELGPNRPVEYHDLPGTVRGLLVLRTFELWTHGDDIRDATDQPLNLLDEGRLSLMVNELMRVLPLGLVLAGCPQPGRTARLNLTGPGGGSFDVASPPATPWAPSSEACGPRAEPADDPDAHLVYDVKADVTVQTLNILGTN